MATVVHCPACNQELPVPDQPQVTLTCPSCQAHFPAPKEEIEALPEAVAAATPRPEAFADDDEDSDGPHDLGRFLRATFLESEGADPELYHPFFERHAYAKSAVKGPAIALMILGSLAILQIAFGGLAMLTMLAAGPGPGGFGPFMPSSWDIITSLFPFCWGTVILTSAYQMMRLRMYQYAFAGAIVAMIPCSYCCVLGIPFGIWALVVLNYAEVRRAFEYTHMMRDRD